MTKKKSNRQREAEVEPNSSVSISKEEKVEGSKLKKAQDRKKNQKFSQAVNAIRKRRSVQMEIKRKHYIKGLFSQLLFIASFRIKAWQKNQAIWQGQLDQYKNLRSSRFHQFFKSIDELNLKEAFLSVNPDFWGENYSRRLTDIKRKYKPFQRQTTQDIMQMKADKLAYDS